MKLNEILLHIAAKQVIDNGVDSFSHIVFDSRKVKPGTLFVAVRGVTTDGHNFIPQAIESGAVAIICEELPNVINKKVCYIQAENASIALAEASAAFYGFPSEKIKLVGVTGTNGKTTIATTLYNLVTKAGFKAGLLSTVKNIIDGESIPASHTTPDSLSLNRMLADMVERGCEYCFIEVSSHAIVQHRVTALCFTGGIFTNITHDHLDYHHTFSEYIKAKKAFFDMLPKEAFALTNIDDKNGEVMLQNSNASKHSYSLMHPADFKAQILESDFNGMLLNINRNEIWSHFTGRFNAYNLLAIYGTAMLLGFESQESLSIISSLHAVDGRFQTFRSQNDITAIVDYAHTPDALNNVLLTISQIKISGARIITVVGAGGNRDKTKRPEMARVAALHSNKLILTSDNPRFEKPEDIISHMEQGLAIDYKTKTLKITDRREAIRTACMLAQPGDVILIAGKGHETYQEIEGVKHHFDDREIVLEILNNLS